MAVQTKMTAEEFFRLPESMTLTELIAGELIIAPSPVPKHRFTSIRLYDTVKAAAGEGTILLAPIDVYLTEIDVVQPDLLWIAPNGLCKVGDKYLSGAPDLIAEILSPSTALRDKQTKFRLYERHGVREYWIVEPMAEYVEVWYRVDEKFTLHGVFGIGEVFTSAVLGQKLVDVSAIFGSENPKSDSQA